MGLGKYFDECDRFIEDGQYSLALAVETYEKPGGGRTPVGPVHISGTLTASVQLHNFLGLSRMILELEDGRRIAFTILSVEGEDKARIQCFGDFYEAEES